MVQNHVRGPFNPKYIGDYHVVSLRGNQVEVQPSIGGPTEMKHIKHVKYILPAERYIKQLPDYSAFGRKATLRMNPDKIPDLNWKLANTYHTTNIGQTRLLTTDISTQCVDVNTTSYAEGNKCGEWYGITLNTDTITFQSNIEPVICFITSDSNKV